MKIYPKQKPVKELHDAELSVKDALMRKIAIGIAFASVFFFFIKLLFL